MWIKLLMWITLTLLLPVQPVRAEELVRTEEFRVGPLYENEPGAVSVVVELPYGVTKPDAANFQLLIKDKIVATAHEVKTFLSSGKELGWLLCVDVSGTMAGNPLDDIKKALLSFLNDRRALRVALMPFGTKIGPPVLAFKAGEPSALTAAIDSLKAEGPKSKTRFYQALYEALDYYEGMRTNVLPLRKRIMVISDGKDEGSSASADSVIKRAKALGIPIDAVGRGKIEDQFIESLRGLAQDTGGRFVHAQPDVVSTQDALKRIYRELMETQTVVAYFKYQPSIGNGLTEKVAVELKRPGTLPLSGSIDAKIPLPAQPTSLYTNKLWLWLLAAILAFLLAGLIAVIIGRRKPKPPEQLTQPDYRLEIIPVSPLVITEEIPKLERHTQVGSYFLPPALGQPTVILVCISGPLQGQQFSVEKDIFNIGANPENDLVIANDDYVSGNHACLRYDKGALLLTDQHSRNGTFLNENQLTDIALTLDSGDRIRVGNSTFELIRAPGR